MIRQIDWYNCSVISTKKLMFWLEKSKPYQFYYIAIEVKIGPPIATWGCMLWAPFLVWDLGVSIGSTKRLGSSIWGISVFTDTLMSILNEYVNIWVSNDISYPTVKLNGSTKKSIAQLYCHGSKYEHSGRLNFLTFYAKKALYCTLPFASALSHSWACSRKNS